MLKHYDKAVEACDFALAVKENEESIISFKGYCYYDSGQYEKAIEQFLEYESITKEKSVAYELIGECYVKLDDNNNALKFFHKALDIEPRTRIYVISWLLVIMNWEIYRKPLFI